MLRGWFCAVYSVKSIYQHSMGHIPLSTRKSRWFGSGRGLRRNRGYPLPPFRCRLSPAGRSRGLPRKTQTIM